VAARSLHVIVVVIMVFLVNILHRCDGVPVFPVIVSLHCPDVSLARTRHIQVRDTSAIETVLLQ